MLTVLPPQSCYLPACKAPLAKLEQGGKDENGSLYTEMREYPTRVFVRLGCVTSAKCDGA